MTDAGSQLRNIITTGNERRWNMLTYCDIVLKYQDQVKRLEYLSKLHLRNGSLSPEDWERALKKEGEK